MSEVWDRQRSCKSQVLAQKCLFERRRKYRREKGRNETKWCIIFVLEFNLYHFKPISYIIKAISYSLYQSTETSGDEKYVIRLILESLKYNWKSQNFNSKSSWNYEMNPEKILLLITWNKICINLLWDSSGSYVKMNHFLKILHFFSLFHVIYHCFKDNFTVKNNQITYLKCYRFELINLWSI